MRILFTRNSTLLSRLICRVTREPVSHCALHYGDFVIHSNLWGVHCQPVGTFTSDVIYSLDVPDRPDAVIAGLAKYQGSAYDFGALLYLGLRALFPSLPKQNLWQSSGLFLCTEWVTTILNDKADSMITPYRLFLELESTQEKEQ